MINCRQTTSGIAMIVTLLVIVILTITVTAFMQSMSLERRTAQAYLNILRAENAADSGTDAALTRLLSYTESAVPKRLSDFHYVVGKVNAGNATKQAPSLVKLGTNSPTAISTSELASRSASGSPKRYQFSFNQGADLREVDLLEVNDASGQLAARYGFYVEPATSKQSLAELNKQTRSFGAQVGEMPLIKADKAALGTSEVASLNTFLAANASWRGLLLTPADVNQFANITPQFDDWLVEKDTWSPAYNQLGKVRVNLRRLKYYVDNLAVSQAASNPRSLVVESLLNQSNQTLQTNWGGGDLSWLIDPQNPKKYTLVEGRQIVANLLDYIDEDKFPTADSDSNPTYMGLEAWNIVDTGVSYTRGHPAINFVGTGMVFNRSSAAARPGALNSTRILSTLGIVNPWGYETLSWSSSYTLEMSYEVIGTATGGKLGSSAQSYFLQDINENIAVTPAPGGKIPKHTGFAFPERTSGSSGYANNLSFITSPYSAGDYQPPGMSFSGVQIKVKNLRLKFLSSDGRSAYVQILNNLSAKPTPITPDPINMGNSGGSLILKYTSASAPQKNDLHLSSDPRLNFQANSWTLSESKEDSDRPPTPEPASGIKVFSGMSATDGDGLQSVPDAYNWYTATAAEKHLYVRSPDKLTLDPQNNPYDPAKTTDSQIAMDSVGEIGYLSSGRPWQTLRLYQTSSSKTTMTDWTILDSLSTGTMPLRDQTTALAGLYSVNGLINLNTASEQSIRSLLVNVPGLTSSDIDNLTTALRNPPTANLPFISIGDVFQDDKVVWPTVTTDFAKEEFARRIANLLTTKSQVFTVYSYGEALSNNRVVSRSKIKTVIELKPQAGKIAASIVRKITEKL